MPSPLPRSLSWQARSTRWEIVKRLKDEGFSETQAEAVTTIFRDVREADFAQLATKPDIRDLEQRMTIRVGGMLVIATACCQIPRIAAPPICARRFRHSRQRS